MNFKKHIGFKKPVNIVISFSIIAVLAIVLQNINTKADDEFIDNTAIIEARYEDAHTRIANDYNDHIDIQNNIKETVEKEKQAAEEAAKAAEPVKEFIGSYELTAYIATGNPCASGVYPTVNHTVACNSLPLGTKIYIDGIGEFVVEDTGGMAGNVIDIFVSDYSTAINFGRQVSDVYVIKD